MDVIGKFNFVAPTVVDLRPKDTDVMAEIVPEGKKELNVNAELIAGIPVMTDQLKRDQIAFMKKIRGMDGDPSNDRFSRAQKVVVGGKQVRSQPES